MRLKQKYHRPAFGGRGKGAERPLCLQYCSCAARWTSDPDRGIYGRCDRKRNLPERAALVMILSCIFLNLENLCGTYHGGEKTGSATEEKALEAMKSALKQEIAVTGGRMA